MPTPVEYANEKLAQAVYYLAIGAGDIRQRLQLAGLEVLFINSGDLAEWLRAEVEWIRTALTRSPKDGFDGALAGTLHGMRRATGVEIAKRIVDLRYRVQSSLAQ